LLNPKELTMTWGDLPNMVDAIFDGYHDRPGWLNLFANADGRNHVDALFPEGCVEWYELPFPGFPDDWRGMQVDLTECVSTMTTNLPLAVIPAGRTIHDCTPDQLAMLLALASGVTAAGRQSSATTTAWCASKFSNREKIEAQLNAELEEAT
jgi:hypothetical protein